MPLVSSPFSRRQFIAGLGATSLLWARGSGLGAVPTPVAIPAIDTHVHFFNATLLRHWTWPRAESPACTETAAEFMRLAAPVGVAGLVSVEAIDSIEDVEENQWALDQARQNPAILGYIGRLEPGSKDFRRQLARFAADPLFRGIRPRRQFDDLAGCLADPAFHRDLLLLARRGLTFESGGPPASIPLLIRLARQYPDLRIVFEHLPLIESEKENPRELRAALAEAASLPNIFAKASEILRSEHGRVLLDPSSYRPGLDALFQIFGANRVMYGSNWPMPSGLTTYATLQQLAADYVLALGPERAAKFFWRNSVAAYRLDPERVRLRGFALGSAADSGGRG